MRNEVIIEAAERYGKAVNLCDLRFKIEQEAHSNLNDMMQETARAHDDMLGAQRLLLAAVQREGGVDLDDLRDEIER